MRLFSTRSRDSSSGAWRATSSSKVALASSIIAHSSPSPLISIPCRSNRAGSTWVASLPSSRRPSESASRLAGSIVSTQTRRPRAAMPAAIAAEVGLEQEGEGLDRRLHPAPQAGELGALRAGAAELGDRRTGGGAGAAVLARGQLGEALGLLLGEALRVEPVEVDAVDGDADLGAQRALQRRRLVDRHLLRQGDDRGAGVLVIGDQAVELLRLGVDRADAGDRGEGARRLQEPDPLPGGGGVDDHQVVLASLLHLAVELGQLPDLADRDQLLEAGGGGGEVGEDAAADE